MEQTKKATRSLVFSILGIVLGIVLSILHDEITVLRSNDKLSDFLLMLPVSIIAAFGLVYGIESIKSPKRIIALLGILFSLLAIGFIIMFLTLPGACC